MLRLAGAAVNRCLKPLGIKITRNGHDWSDTKNYIPYKSTIAEAKKAGCSVGDYIDGIMNKIPGATQDTINGMARLGVFEKPINTVVEIGPGSGRYLEKTVAACKPRRYEIYETSKPWSVHLKDSYDVVLQPTDGRTLASTPDKSADLVQAHKVFSGVPSLCTFKYWSEMSRVCRVGGFVAFDILTEKCLGITTLRKWINSSIENGAYPAAMPRETAINFFQSENFDLVGTFLIPMTPGTTEVFVFQKVLDLVTSVM
jgi:hypothetical protein